ncbi:hypothetical protein [Halarsenatibacter silvermanii]|uniref:GHMP kinases N terminal domain-containing protein n=1 Tax=Halarsenatibacter silvermanii TaxID=321763 RepID=A0A1G9MWL9_9FIRM|nr:hypothetical protein [Halarsenatibacter silvermanii]SDL78015.1 GHMP kinases N terminal domain-containing protein [Halarsenatibacter silvermanii]
MIPASELNLRDSLRSIDRPVDLAMPASLGEICQGIHRGREQLASYAVDIYNRMIFCPGCLAELSGVDEAGAAADRPQKPGPMGNAGAAGDPPRLHYYQLLPSAGPGRKLRAAAGPLPAKLKKLYRQHLTLRGSAGLPERFSILHICRIPLSRGMGSSTADLALLSAGLAALSGRRLYPGELARRLTAVEPTDSVIFPEITIFEQNRATGWQRLENLADDLRVLALGLPGSIDTVAGRRGRKTPPEIDRAFWLLHRALKEKKAELLGRAALVSAESWQDRLDYPGLEDLIELALSRGSLGVNIAHSGRFAGVIFRPGELNREKFRQDLGRRGLTACYSFKAEYSIVPGGIRDLTAE